MISDWKYNSLLFTVVLLICFSISALVRYQQFDTWEKTPATFFVGERPMMTTLDAPYWLRWAREYNEGTFGKNDRLRGYPESTDRFKEKNVKITILPQKFTDVKTSTNSSSSSSETKAIRYNEVPLLSFLIAKLVPFFNYNYYLTGTLLVPILASLFILPLSIYFFRIGIPLSGLLGGLIGTFASGYYMRSSIGRIDTDMLNLFFPALASLLILLASGAKSDRNVLLYSMGSGLSMFLFNWWYNRPGFTLVYFMVLVFILFLQQIRLRTKLLGVLLFILCSQPGIFLGGTRSVEGFLGNYFVIEETSSYKESDKGSSPANFPNVLKTISEADTVDFDAVFQRILSNKIFDWAGFLAFFVLMFLRWRLLLPLAPMLALGLLSFQSANRFIMFLAPFIGIGLGWLLQLSIETIFIFLAKYFQHRKGNEGIKANNIIEKDRIEIKGTSWTSFYSLLKGSHIEPVTKDIDNKVKRNRIKGEWAFWNIHGFDWFGWFRQVILYLGMGVFFMFISSQTAISFVPGPSIHTGIYSTFFEVKKRVHKDSALLTWWDYGFAITDATGLATFHDGSSQFSPKTYFIARGLTSREPKELYDIIQFLSTEGNSGIAENNTSPQNLMLAVRNPKQKPWDSIYLFFTADMIGKYGAISKIGSWDIEKGGSRQTGYRNLACNKITNQEIICHGATIDLKTGKINNQLLLRRLIFFRNGEVLREQKFGNSRGYSLQLRVDGRQIVEVQLIDEDVFNSNFNQMFLLGRYPKDLFEETYNAFPFSRLYRIKF